MPNYGSGRGGRPWRRKRDRILQRDNYLCVPCATKHKLTVAKEVDHIQPLAKGGTDDDDNLQSICVPCHTAKSAQEGNQFVAAIPTYKRKPLIPVTLVCGPSGSGKTTYVRREAGANDLVLDMDEIVSRLSGQPMYHAGPEWVNAALGERNARLGALANPSPYTKTWLIVQAPTYSERRKWQEMLNAEVIVFAVDEDTCKARLKDRHKASLYCSLVDTWWAKYSAGRNEIVKR